MSFQQILGRKPENFRDYMQATGQFIFGGNTGDTYETLQQKRQVAGRLAANASRAPKTAGEGLTALGQAIAYRRLMNQANEGEKAGQEDFNEQFQSLFGADDPYAAFNASLARTESGGNYNITNSEGFAGKYQFGQPRLDDFNRAMGTNYRVADLTAGSPEAAALTEAVQRWNIGDIDSFVTDNGLDRYLGQNIGGVTMTQDGLRAMAHLGGRGGMRRFLTSGGQHNPSDSNGTSLLDYARTHAGGAAPSGPGAMPSAPTGGGIDPRLMAMLDNPYATNGQRAVMQLMLQRQMAASAPPDPMQALQMRQAQLGIERSQLELDRLRNPTVDPMQQIELERAQIELEQLRNPDRAIIEGADGFKYYQDTGERVLPGVTQAPADEYQRYVAEEQAAGRQPISRIAYAQSKRGKGTVVFDPTTGRPLVSIGGNADPTDLTNPSTPGAMVASIDGILDDPALDMATGWMAWTQNIPGTASRRFGTRVKQLEGQAFLQAFESLKGGGQITEIEGRKATQAIGRLDTAQSAEDFSAALTELRETLQLGMSRPQGWAANQSGGSPATPTHRFNPETGQIEAIPQ
ncbi:hypothetical protein [Tateyamaria sp.]|uniref:hypothetical protein n=1 Tax=Tateyamaria sp. TaxID=1929288 RepID=UPI003B21E43D